MKKDFLLFAFLMMFVYNSHGQTCSGTWGPPIVDQTFGQGQAGAQYFSPLSTYAPGVTTSTTFITGPLSDNYSCLTYNASFANNWVDGPDHTGNPYGLMFLINAPSSGGTVFVQYTMHDLCPNTTLQLGVWILNADVDTCACGRQYPNMTMEVVDSVTNVILDSAQTGNVPFDEVWHQYTMVFNNGNSSSLILKFINNSVGNGYGNDLALDDITVSPCVPISTILPALDTTICMIGGTMPFTANISGNVYSPAEYQWQYSQDGGATWVDALPAGSIASYNFSYTAPGTYWIRFLAGPVGFSENSNCSAVSDTSIVTVVASPQPPVITGDTVICQGASLVPFNVTGQNILWYNTDTGGVGSAAQPVINTSVIGSGTYYASQTINGCESKRDSISLHIDPGPAFNPYYSNAMPDNCFFCNGAITLHGIITGNTDTISYWYNGVAQPSFISTADNDSAIIINNLCPGIYTDFTIKENVCITDIPGPDTLTLAPLTVNVLQTINATACGVCDGRIILKGVPPNQLDVITYTFNGNSQSVTVISGMDSTITINNLCQGVYDDIVVQAGLCASSPIGPVTLTAPPLIPNFTYAIHYGCNGDTVTFTNISQYTDTVYYRWDFGDHSIDTATNATHIYSYQDTFYVTLFIFNNHCIDSVTDTIPLIHPIKAGFNVTGDTSCQGQPVIFTNTSVGIHPSYQWSFGDGITDTATNPTHTYNNTGIYNVLLTETDFVPCIDTASALIHIDSMSAIYLMLSDSVICEGKEITFTSNYSSIGNIGVTWNFGDGYVVKDVNPVQHSFDTTGTFTVTATAAYRVCPDASDSKEYTVYPYPLVNIGPDTSMCPGQGPISISNIAAQDDGCSYLWSTGDTTGGSILVNDVGIYWLQATTNHGCSSADTAVVKPDCYIDIPNAFTPNGDGINDYFFPRQLLSDGITSFKMEIYNRWGQEIFGTTNTEGRGWDGKFNNELQPQGVYIYIIDVSFKNGQQQHHQGNVTLLK